MPDMYSVASRYQTRPSPSYDEDPDDGVTWQPDVYRMAASVAEAVGAGRIIDIGCGRGAKLAALHPRFELIGLDYGQNIAHCESTYPFGTWIDHDLETPGSLPLGADDVQGAVIVCADVVEHLVQPQRLLEKLSIAARNAEALLISTPERELWSGIRHAGPPRNVCHVREWSIREFGALLRASGMPVHSVGLTRSNDRTEELHTILAAVAPNEDALRRLESTIIDASPSPSKHHPALHRIARLLRIALRG